MPIPFPIALLMSAISLCAGGLIVAFSPRLRLKIANPVEEEKVIVVVEQEVPEKYWVMDNIVVEKLGVERTYTSSNQYGVGWRNLYGGEAIEIFQRVDYGDEYDNEECYALAELIGYSVLSSTLKQITVEPEQAEVETKAE